MFSPLVPIETLESGCSAEVVDLCAASPFLARLGELGLRPGVRVRVVRGGSPCLLQIGAARFSLRLEDAQQVLVRPVPSDLALLNEVA